MENQTQKWVNLSYLLLAALLGYLVSAGLVTLGALYDWEARVPNIELVSTLVSVGAGALLFLILYRHPVANDFMNEVVTELSRVTWPTSHETIRSTFVVIIMVLISGMFLGGLDALWAWMIQLVV